MEYLFPLFKKDKSSGRFVSLSGLRTGNVINEWRKPEFSGNYFNKSIKVDEIAVESVCQHRKERLWLFIVAKYIDHDILMSAPRCNHFWYGSWLLHLTVGLCEAYRSTGWASAFWTVSIAVIILLSTATLQALLWLCFFCFCFCRASIYLSYHLINPLNPKSDQHLISPFSITPESHINVIRVKEIITRKGTFQ